ncbi:alpha/beta hydrolase [Bacterioplanes sanyensis]|uniref:Alpha/beta hydrolase n=1 Tax=Bacterioplanes sanyensis TaxID=1249553 RepID=A0A222FIS0_9GAMM|nr:alpha/beta hydrolase [Bacterioplanes sanyensis]ASP38496.1 alpha/beta hydrolase [Bacterioplanes sanyensis]
MWDSIWSQWMDFWQEPGSIPLTTLQQRHEYPESRYVSIDGMNVHYRDVGSGPVLLCLHGIFASCHTWEGWSEALQQDFRVISVDCPNFGITGPHPQGMREHLYSDFIARFLDTLHIDRCHLAGNSLGGWMSWEFAGRYPKRVDKVILLDSAGFFFVPPPILMLMGLPLMGWISSHLSLPRMMVRTIVRSTYARPERLSRPVAERYFDLLMRSGNRSAAANVLAFIRNRGGFNKKWMSQVQAPVLILWGEQDQWIPVTHVDKFQRKLPQAEVIRYADCGHLPMEEIPQQSADDARTFLLC